MRLQCRRPGSIPGLGGDPLEKGMETHFSILAWDIPGTEEPGGLQSLELQRVGHNRVTNTGGVNGRVNKSRLAFNLGKSKPQENSQQLNA